MKYKPVAVYWLDSMGSAGWHTLKKSDLECVTVGHLYAKDKNRVTIALNRSAYGYGDYMEIPRKAVRRIKRLKE